MIQIATNIKAAATAWIASIDPAVIANNVRFKDEAAIEREALAGGIGEALGVHVKAAAYNDFELSIEVGGKVNEMTMLEVLTHEFEHQGRIYTFAGINERDDVETYHDEDGPWDENIVITDLVYRA